MIELAIALSPIILLFIVMILMKKPAINAMPITYFSSVAIGIFYWKINPDVLGAASIKGVLIAIDIIFIIIGAIFLLEILKKAKLIQSIDDLLKHISHDRRIHAIIIAWSFSAFIEGASGFGTPAALSAPLLVGLGIGALPAVIVSLIANSTPVSFGAVGTPIIIGLGSSIEGSSEIMLRQIGIYTALIHSLIGLFIPLAISCALTKFGKEKSFRKGLEIWPFALFAGACFVVPYFIIAVFLGPEFPSLLGGLIGFAVLIIGAKKGFFIPSGLRLKNIKFEKRKAVNALMPYFFVAALLVLSRIGALNSILKKADISAANLLGAGISHTFYPLLSPGLIFIIAALATLILIKLPARKSIESVKITASKCLYGFLTLAFAIALVQLFIFSGSNSSGLPSIPLLIANSTASFAGKAFVLFSPFIGMFGAFIAGSNTVSNLLFASFQQQTALALGLPAVIILALQTVGGAVGNMIAIHNIIAASATVGLKGEEGVIVKSNILIASAYALIAGMLGFIIIMFLQNI